MSLISKKVVRFENSMASLPQDSPLRRKPRPALRSRPQAFADAFEDRILFYDCFFYADDPRILLIGPPPHNLAEPLKTAAFRAFPSGQVLEVSFYPSRSTMTTSLEGAPKGTTHIVFNLEGETYQIPVQPESSSAFADQRVLFTINKNNRLDWIKVWAQWHVKTQGTDAIILFDNESTDYSVEQIEECLADVDGLETIAVIPLPYKFGPLDKWVFAYHFWPRFLQISATSLALRRFGMRAQGLINCDIDELMWGYGQSVYTLAAKSELGMLRIPGQWIESVFEGPEPKDHFDFRYRAKGVRAMLSPPKCALDPKRDWVKDLQVHPYLHRIHGAPKGARRLTDQARFWHFKGINTNWKEDRTQQTSVQPRRHALDTKWLEAAQLERDR